MTDLPLLYEAIDAGDAGMWVVVDIAASLSDDEIKRVEDEKGKSQRTVKRWRAAGLCYQYVSEHRGTSAAELRGKLGYMHFAHVWHYHLQIEFSPDEIVFMLANCVEPPLGHEKFRRELDLQYKQDDDTPEWLRKGRRIAAMMPDLTVYMDGAPEAVVRDSVRWLRTWEAELKQLEEWAKGGDV